MKDQSRATAQTAASIALPSGAADAMGTVGIYKVQCFEYEGGPLLWEDEVHNLLVTTGRNFVLDTTISGSGYTVTGPYMGLISSVGYTAIAAADTMASHTGWTEAGTTNAPTFASRGSPAFSAASNGTKSTSAVVSFTMTSGGTLKGSFICLGTGAVTTIGSTAGTLLSAGLFSGGDQVVSNGNVVTVTYSLSLT